MRYTKCEMSKRKDTELELVLRHLVKLRAQGHDLDDMLSIIAYMLREDRLAINQDLDSLNRLLIGTFGAKVKRIDREKPKEHESKLDRFLDTL